MNEQARRTPHTPPLTLALLLAVPLLVAAALACGLAAAPARAAAAATSPSAGALTSTTLPEGPAAVSLPGPTWAPAQTSAAPKPGAGGWYWPVGTDHFPNYGSWLEKRGSYVHVAQDMGAPVGHPVYAIGDGKVWISRADTGGYGPGGSPGGCMIIVHTTASGQQFRALYGHIQGLRYKAGQTVPAGAVIATINGCAHLHFSIHPSTVYKDGNMYAGHVPASWPDHGGFVDPVAFLKTHPRQVKYVAPKPPKASIGTHGAVSNAGAADGIAYWTEDLPGGKADYRLDLRTGVRRQLHAGEKAPAFDTARYVVQVLAAPALGLTVSDRLPRLAVGKTNATPDWDATANVAGKLTSAGGKPFSCGKVVLERLSGSSWIEIGSNLTAGDGSVTLAFTPTEATKVRLRFEPPAAQPAASRYLSATSDTVQITPHAGVSTPSLPKTVTLGNAVTVVGTLAPRHPAGSGGLDLVFQQQAADGAWQRLKTVQADVVNGGAGMSAYRLKLRMTVAGKFRVMAVARADAGHAFTRSGWFQYSVK